METVDRRRSRMRRQSTGRRLELTPRDIEIFKLLSRYRYLRSTFIHAFVGGDRTKLIERLGHLYHEGGYLNRPVQQWQSINARYQPAVYELDARGVDALIQTGAAAEPATWLAAAAVHRQFAHALMVCDLLASIELGVRENSLLRFVSWQEIVSHPRWPKAARAVSLPFEVVLTILPDGSAATRSQGSLVKIVPDAVFGIEYTSGDRRTYRFFALEADRTTMPVTRSTLRQSSYLKKLLAYREIIDRKLYHSQFGLPNLFILTVTTGGAHLEKITKTLGELAADTRFFLFKATPDLQPFGRLPAATSHMLTEPWVRVGFPPLSLDTP